MENKFNLADPVLVYATVDSISLRNGKVVYDVIFKTNNGEEACYAISLPEELLQTVF